MGSLWIVCKVSLNVNVGNCNGHVDVVWDHYA